MLFFRWFESNILKHYFRAWDFELNNWTSHQIQMCWLHKECKWNWSVCYLRNLPTFSWKYKLSTNWKRVMDETFVLWNWAVVLDSPDSDRWTRPHWFSLVSLVSHTLNVLYCCWLRNQEQALSTSCCLVWQMTGMERVTVTISYHDRSESTRIDSLLSSSLFFSLLLYFPFVFSVNFKTFLLMFAWVIHWLTFTFLEVSFESKMRFWWLQLSLLLLNKKLNW